jgi:hypothetical protein
MTIETSRRQIVPAGQDAKPNLAFNPFDSQVNC